MSKQHTVRANLLLTDKAKKLYDILPHGARRAVLSQLMEAFAELDGEFGPLALHAIQQGKFSIGLDLKDEARRVLDDVARDKENTGVGGIVSRDERQGAKGANRTNKNKARGEAA